MSPPRDKSECTTGDCSDDANDCACSSFPALPPLRQQIRPDKVASYRFQVTSNLGLQDLRLRWCLAWALVSGGMTYSDGVVFGVMPLQETLHPSLNGKDKDKTGGPVAVHMQLSTYASIAQGIDSLQRQLERGPRQPSLNGKGAMVHKTPKFQAVLGARQLGEHGNPGFGIPVLPLLLELVLGDHVATAVANFDSRVVERWLVDKLLERLGAVLQQLIDAEQPLSAVDAMTCTDMDEIWRWNSHVPAPAQELFHHVFDKRVASQPDRAALCAWDGELTYRQLDRLAVNLSVHLCQLGVTPGTRIPLCFEKSLWTAVGILAVLKAGSAFVLLDPSMPEKRLAGIVRRLDSPLIVSSASNQGLSSRLLARVVVVRQDSMATLAEAAPLHLPPIPPMSPMYVVFTSGSTGVPKGVVVTQASAASALMHQRDSLGYPAATRLYDFSSYSFDAAVANVLTALYSGGCLCVPRDQDRKDDLAESIVALRANAIFLPPTVARLLDPSRVSTLELLMLGGETLHESDVQRWWETAHVTNVYGPTECTPFSLFNPGAETPGQACRIGRGVGQVTWVVDPADADTLLPVGCTGELLLEGPLNANHYLDSPAETAASFIAPPRWLRLGAAGRPGRGTGRLYKTGDLVAYNGDGSLTYVGRKDTQVKIRGQRVELGEIEHQLLKHMPRATQAVADVVTFGGPRRLPALVAFVHVAELVHMAEPLAGCGGPLLTAADLAPINDDETAVLGEHLPPYMVPAVTFSVPAMPRAATEKIDRKQLRDLAASFLSFRQRLEAEPPQQPLTRLEHQLQQVWGRVFGVECDAIGLGTDFFRLGGTSILAMEIVAEARRMGTGLSVADVLSHPVLRDMARRGRRLSSGSPEAIRPFSLLGDKVDLGLLLQYISSRYQLDPAAIEDAYPTTPLQDGLMSLSWKQPGDYIMQRVLRLSPDVTMDAFRRSWDQLAQSLGLLRTRIVPDGRGAFVQLVLRELPCWTEATGLQDHLDADRQRPMDMGDRLVRYALVRETAAGDPRWFALTMHHAIYDGWTLPLVMDMAARAYQGHRIDPGPDYNIFIRYVAQQNKAAAADYWHKALAGCESVPFPAVQASARPPMADRELGHLLPPLQAQSSAATPSALVLAAWALVAGQATNSRHVSFGVVVSGRSAPVDGIGTMAGPTIATVPFLVQLGNRRIKDLLECTQRQSTDMIAFEQTGLQHIAKISAACRRACSFQTLVIVQPPGQPSALDGPTGTWLDACDEHLNTYALVVQVHLGANTATARFDSRVVEPGMVQRLLERLGSVLSQLAKAEPQQMLADMDMCTAQDLKQIWQWNRDVPVTIERHVDDMIHQQARSRPDAVALDAWDGKMTYRELDRMATGLAHRLIDLGVGQNELIPLLFDKSVWAIVAMLGVLKVSAGFVFLSPCLPNLRLAAIGEQVDSGILLSCDAHMSLGATLSRRTIPVGPGLVCREPPPDRPLRPRPPPAARTMYAVFTSGSTGTPKGVLVSHANFCSALEHQLPHLGFDAQSRVLDFASYVFDAAIHNIVATLAVGGCLCIPAEHHRTDNLAGMLAALAPTIANLTPTVARLVEPATVPASLTTLILLGEAVNADDTQRWWGRVRLINSYGPAECTPVSTINAAPSTAPEATGIGRGAGAVTWVVDPDNHERLLPPGCVGELVLEGPIVGLGYLGDAQRTAASFIRDPGWLSRGVPGVGSGRCGRLYKTGDLVRYNQDGSLTYVCRKDTQVKVRGQRVELGDVEHHLHMAIADAAHVVAEVCRGRRGPVLCAFVQPKPGINTDAGASVAIYYVAAAARKMLRNQLPSHMVPSVFLCVAGFPLTASGKTDRKRLRGLGQAFLESHVDGIQDPATDVAADAPILETEQPAYRLAQKIYSMLPSLVARRDPTNSAVLGFNDIFLHSSGLDSVNMMVLIHFMEHTFQVKVPMRVLFDSSMSVRTLARIVSLGHAADSTWSHSASSLLVEIDKHYSAIWQERGSPFHVSHGPSAMEDADATKRQQTVLLTGATGFLGTQLLRQLLEHRHVGRVLALVRAETETAARQRTIAAATKALWWTDMHEEKLQVWRGDLSLPRLGLDAARWRVLEGIDVVIHNGAAVHWAKSYASLEATNVGSTVELARVVTRAPHMRFIYIAGGQRWDSRARSEEDMAIIVSEAGDVGYSQTKFVAEAVVRRAAACHLARRVCIVTPGLIVGTPGEGVANADDYLWRLVAACIRVGAYNSDQADVWLSVSDAESTASTIIDAAVARETVPVETHVCDGMPWRTVWDMLKDMGYRLDGRDSASWLALVHGDIGAVGEAHPLWSLAHMLEHDGAHDTMGLDAKGEIPLKLKVAISKSAESLARAGVLPLPTGDFQIRDVDQRHGSRYFSRQAAPWCQTPKPNEDAIDA